MFGIFRSNVHKIVFYIGVRVDQFHYSREGKTEQFELLTFNLLLSKILPHFVEVKQQLLIVA